MSDSLGNILAREKIGEHRLAEGITFIVFAFVSFASVFIAVLVAYCCYKIDINNIVYLMSSTFYPGVFTKRFELFYTPEITGEATTSPDTGIREQSGQSGAAAKQYAVVKLVLKADSQQPEPTTTTAATDLERQQDRQGSDSASPDTGTRTRNELQHPESIRADPKARQHDIAKHRSKSSYIRGASEGMREPLIENNPELESDRNTVLQISDRQYAQEMQNYSGECVNESRVDPPPKASVHDHDDTKHHRVQEEVLLIAGLTAKSSCCARFTYWYFVMMALLTVLWFLVIFTDNLLYRKTANCNDINVSNNRFKCYYISDFSAVTSCITDDEVICYLVNFNPSMALGIAAGVVQAITFVTEKSFRFAVTLSCKGSRWLVVILQILSIGVVITVMILGSVDVIGWFLYGLSVMRIMMLCLLGFTLAGIGLLPWWAVDCSCAAAKCIDVGIKGCTYTHTEKKNK